MILRWTKRNLEKHSRIITFVNSSYIYMCVCVCVCIYITATTWYHICYNNLQWICHLNTHDDTVSESDWMISSLWRLLSYMRQTWWPSRGMVNWAGINIKYTSTAANREAQESSRTAKLLRWAWSVWLPHRGFKIQDHDILRLNYW